MLFGGRSANGVSGETWEFDGANWALVTTTGAPPARYDHALAYDSARGQCVVFGGADSVGSYLVDTWQFDGISWIQTVTAAAPTGRILPALSYDSIRGRTVLFGGSRNGYLADTWEFDGANWAQIGIAVGKAPAGRYGHALTYDSLRGRAVLFGGFGIGASGYLADTWELQPTAAATWTRYGRGCGGSAGTPLFDLLSNALPVLGSGFPLQFTSLPATPGVLYLGFGFGIARWNGSALPIDLVAFGLPTCKLWIAPEPGAAVIILHAGGSWNYSLAIPPDPGLRGLRIDMQALVLDAASPNGIGGGHERGGRDCLLVRV